MNKLTLEFTRGEAFELLTLLTALNLLEAEHTPELTRPLRTDAINEKIVQLETFLTEETT